jgi:hypothetical protein
MKIAIYDMSTLEDGPFSWTIRTSLDRTSAEEEVGQSSMQSINVIEAPKINTKWISPGHNDDGHVANTLCYSLVGVLPLIFVLIRIWARSVSHSSCHHRSDPRVTGVQHGAPPVVGSGLCRLSSLAALRYRRELFQAGFRKVSEPLSNV